jgi:type I restriction enzyme, R subunit
VTPDAAVKTLFVLIVCVGVSEQELTDAPPLERQYSVAFDKLLNLVGYGSTDPDVLSSLAGRLARLDRQLGPAERRTIAAAAGGATLQDIVGGLIAALDPDAHLAAARATFGLPPAAEPAPEQVEAAREALLETAALPLAANPDLRAALVDVKRRHEQTIDRVSKDVVLEAAFSAAATERAKALTESFERFIEDNKDEIAALQVLYSRPYGARLRLRDIRALAEAIKAPPRAWTPEALWRAYETLDAAKVRGSGGRMLTDVVTLVRYAIRADDELAPYRERVEERYAAWLAAQEADGRRFTAGQRQWLAAIKDHVAASLTIGRDDFDYAPFAQRGGLGRVYQLFGAELDGLLEELNEVLAA